MKILEQGQVIVQKSKEPIQTILGSCVSVAVFCTDTHLSGMNHFALPFQGNAVDMPERYGIHAMEYLLNELYKKGARKSALRVLYAGGACLRDSKYRIGYQNIGFVEDFCQTESLKIIFRDVGGFAGRRVVFKPLDTRLHIKLLNISGEGVEMFSLAQKNGVELFE